MSDWSDPHRIPLGAVARARISHDKGTPPDPEGIQANLFTLAQIGGVYDLLALEVEKDHLGILTAWRLDSGAPRAIDYIRARAIRTNEQTRNETPCPKQAPSPQPQSTTSAN